MIKDLLTTTWTGDVDGTDFKWERKPQNYSGFYQLDTGSVIPVFINRAINYPNITFNFI